MLEPIFSAPALPEKPAEAPVKTESPAIKPPLRKLTRAMSGPSIRSVLNGGSVTEEKVDAKEQHELYTRQDLTEPFTEEQLRLKWKEFLNTLDDRPNLKSTLSRDPELQPQNLLLLKIENQVQEELVKGIKPQLVSWLRRELRNSSIELETELVMEETTRFAYTDGEKLEEMLKKNPDLALLKQKFNLDFDN